MDRDCIKTFVIDTNVLIHKPDAIMSFRDNEVVLPLSVLEELDRLKTYSDERGRNARHAIRFLDNLRKNGDLNKGVKIGNGSTLTVELSHNASIPVDLRQDREDNKIIFTAYALQQQGKHVFFVSKDINARVKARALGIKAVDYEKQNVNIDTLYQGCQERDISSEMFRELRDNGVIKLKEQFKPNEYLLLHRGGEEEYLIGRYRASDEAVALLDNNGNSYCGISPLNERQEIAMDLLLDDSVQLVSLLGLAGTGKTLLALAAGLYKVLEKKQYSELLVSRPVIPMGKDIGYLPGSKEEKLSNWMQPIYDNFENILRAYKKSNLKTVEQLLATNKIEVEALTYIRGRSLPEQYIIVDEAQNLSPHEIKTIVSRAGDNTKVVLTGDPYQIDSPYLDSNSNGLTYVVEAFKGESIFGHITLQKSERSKLAELAAELL